jgi:putative membrane protein
VPAQRGTLPVDSTVLWRSRCEPPLESPSLPALSYSNLGKHPLRVALAKGHISGRIRDYSDRVQNRRTQKRGDFFMKRVLATLVLAAPFAAYGANSSPDSTFYKHAAEGGIAEVELGNLAQQKSTNASLKGYGAMMVKDHTAANDKLKGIASSKNISLPTSASIGQMATKAKLEVLSGEAFDKSYIKRMIKDHEEDIALFKKEAASGKDPDAKTFASATFPTLQAHLKKIKSIAASAGVTAH